MITWRPRKVPAWWYILLFSYISSLLLPKRCGSWHSSKQKPESFFSPIDASHGPQKGKCSVMRNIDNRDEPYPKPSLRHTQSCVLEQNMKDEPCCHVLHSYLTKPLLIPTLVRLLGARVQYLYAAPLPHREMRQILFFGLQRCRHNNPCLSQKMIGKDDPHCLVAFHSKWTWSNRCLRHFLRLIC
jgi:hypothetical protein